MDSRRFPWPVESLAAAFASATAANMCGVGVSRV
jgi:hypothetical protein